MNRISTLSALTLFLIGCGGNSGDSPNQLAAASLADDIRYYAHITTTTSVSNIWPTNTIADAFFTEFPDLTSASLLLSDFEFELGCNVVRQTRQEMESSTENAVAGIPEGVGVSAGDNLTITSPSGTWAELIPYKYDLGYENGVDYPGEYTTERENSDGDLGVMPDNAVLDVPGDVFPQLRNVALLGSGALSGVEVRENGAQLTSNAEPKTPATSFHWDPINSNGNSFIYIALTNIEESSDPAADVFSSVGCIVEDTGSFFFPESIAAQMDASYESYFLSRFQYKWEQRGNVLITQLSLSYYYDFDGF